MLRLALVALACARALALPTASGNALTSHDFERDFGPLATLVKTWDKCCKCQMDRTKVGNGWLGLKNAFLHPENKKKRGHSGSRSRDYEPDFRGSDSRSPDYEPDFDGSTTCLVQAKAMRKDQARVGVVWKEGKKESCHTACKPYGVYIDKNQYKADCETANYPFYFHDDIHRRFDMCADLPV